MAPQGAIILGLLEEFQAHASFQIIDIVSFLDIRRIMLDIADRPGPVDFQVGR
jgi:hypothetical protein